MRLLKVVLPFMGEGKVEFGTRSYHGSALSQLGRGEVSDRISDINVAARLKPASGCMNLLLRSIQPLNV